MGAHPVEGGLKGFAAAAQAMLQPLQAVGGHGLRHQQRPQQAIDLIVDLEGSQQGRIGVEQLIGEGK